MFQIPLWFALIFLLVIISILVSIIGIGYYFGGMYGSIIAPLLVTLGIYVPYQVLMYTRHRNAEKLAAEQAEARKRGRDAYYTAVRRSPDAVQIAINQYDERLRLIDPNNEESRYEEYLIITERNEFNRAKAENEYNNANAASEYKITIVKNV